jgi:hypothetical protein
MSKGKSKRKAWEGPTTANGKTTTRTEAYERTYGKKAPMSKIIKESTFKVDPDNEDYE